MKKANLDKAGWDQWTDVWLNQRERWIASLPSEPAVYAIVFPIAVAYPRGSSDIAYLGCANAIGGLREAMKRHFPAHVAASAHKSLYELVQLIPSLALGYRLINPEQESAREVVDNLLREFHREHGDVPVLNLEAAPASNNTDRYAEAS